MSKSSFFFYDLETSGLSPSLQRIMQFAGQRTDSDLNPIGEPLNVLVKLTEDILPDPEAVMITKTTPQMTLADGISEPELIKLLTNEVFTPDTIIVGFNNIRFDDEFLRFTCWRNFYDPYEWSYKDNRSRWDILDVVRMTRALRPKGIQWPLDTSGQPTNRLEELSKANGLDHTKAHDALSDVTATIKVARLIKQTQPKLFAYLLDMRLKSKVAELINLKNPVPFVYSSGRYGRTKNFTTVGFPVTSASRDGGLAVYDLSVDPEPFFSLTSAQLREKLFASRPEKLKKDFVSLPVKELFYNKVPAVAPITVMDDASWQRLGLDKDAVMRHVGAIKAHPAFAKNLAEAYAQKPAYALADDVESRLYDGFISDSDKPRMAIVRAADQKTLADFKPDFADDRFNELYLRYKARHYPKLLKEDERQTWDDYRKAKFTLAAPQFMARLQKIVEADPGSETTQFLATELRLWVETIAPLE